MRSSIALGLGLVLIGWTVVHPPPVRADAFSDYGLVSSFSLPGGVGEFGILNDGRLITVDGASVYEETAAGSRSFAWQGTLAGMDVASFGPAFVRVSPDGTKLAVGNNGGASFDNFQVGVFDLATLGGTWFAANHFDAAWYGDTQLVLTAGMFGQPSVVTVLDITSPSPSSPVNPTVIDNIGGASAGIAFDPGGRLYTGNGFAGAGPSGTGAIKGFAPAAWTPALAGGPAADFEAGGTLIADILSANALGFDAEGHLHVGGGDFGSGDSDYAGLIHAAAVANAIAGGGPADPADPAQVRRLDPDTASGFNFYDVDYNAVTEELYVREGGTVYVYVVPEPSACLLLLAGAGFALSRNRSLRAPCRRAGRPAPVGARSARSRTT